MQAVSTGETNTISDNKASVIGIQILSDELKEAQKKALTDSGSSYNLERLHRLRRNLTVGTNSSGLCRIFTNVSGTQSWQ